MLEASQCDSIHSVLALTTRPPVQYLMAVIIGLRLLMDTREEITCVVQCHTAAL